MRSHAGGRGTGSIGEGPGDEVVERDWTDPRDQRRWLVRARGRTQSVRRLADKEAGTISFRHPPDPEASKEYHVTPHGGEVSLEALDDQSLMDLLDRARKAAPTRGSVT